MIKVEIRDEIQYFVNRNAFCQWLIDNGYCRSLEFFTNEEYYAWDIVQGVYTFADIKNHWWNSEVYDIMLDWFESGLAEEI